MTVYRSCDGLPAAGSHIGYTARLLLYPLNVKFVECLRLFVRRDIQILHAEDTLQ